MAGRELFCVEKVYPATHFQKTLTYGVGDTVTVSERTAVCPLTIHTGVGNKSISWIFAQQVPAQCRPRLLYKSQCIL
jgi:hypothetical protein